MAKMPMTRNPKTGKMVPSFAMDGKGAGDLKKMRGGGMMAKGYNIGGAIDEIKNKKTTKGMAKGGAVKPMAKGGPVKMRGGGMNAKGYKAGGRNKSKGGTKGGARGGTKVTRADGIARKGKTKGRTV